MKPLSQEDMEYLKWLTRIERRAIIPIKWMILLISLMVWFWSAHFTPPSPEVFMLFLLYGMFNLAQSYFFYASRITPEQVKPFCYVSYFIDIAFVTLLIYMDTTRYYGQNVQSDFYVLYFLLILRGFALFRRSGEAILTSIIISGLFITTIRFRETSFDFINQRTFALKFALIWMVGIMSWFIVEMINRQKMELMRTRERLLRSEQFAALGQLAAGVAHEINNPIAIISAYADYLLKNSSQDSNLKDDYETIRREARRCGKIVSQLLDMSNPSAREIVESDIIQLNEEVLSFIFHEKKDATALFKDIDYKSPPILADPVQIKQALLNIYLNAKQAMNESAEKKIFITIKTIVEDESDKILLTVRDTGPGIIQEDLDKVFDPFFTRKKDGTGLGLSITCRIIEGHNGSISIKNAPEGGTIVEILLPAV